MIKKTVIILIKKLDALSAVACRLTKLTGKSTVPIHPKHLISSKIWFVDYLKKSDKVLDLGSSIGQISLKIAPRVKLVLGIEVNRDLINIAQISQQQEKKENANFIQGDLNKKFLFNDSEFDVVICSDVLEHLYRRDQALKEINRVLKKKGRLFLVTDNPNTSWKKLQKLSGIFYYADSEHKYEYPKEEILELLAKNNFLVNKVETVTYDTPLRGPIDLIGGFSLSLYSWLYEWKKRMNEKFPDETTGYRIIALKK